MQPFMASLDDGLLYERIMYVPGLTGSTWKDRVKEYYKQLTGKAYTGSLDEGLYMLKQIGKRNFPAAQVQQAQTQQQPAQTTNPVVDTAKRYTDPITGQVIAASEIPQFENVMPFLDSWNQMVPQATQAAQSQINPEVMRNYNQQYRDYMYGMTGSGGERFGRGLSGVGNLKAAAERDRQGQLQDWLSSYQKGFQEFFYEPSRSAWNSARTQVQPGETFDQTPKLPTWDDLYGTLSGAGGTASSTSPLYG